MLKRLIVMTIIFISGCTSKTTLYTPPRTVDELRNEVALLNRVSKITHNILVANSAICSKTRADYGFRATSLNSSATKEQKELGRSAFHLKKEPTVTLVIPKSSAEKAGMHTGDVILSVNGNLWSEVSSQDAFVKLLDKAMRSSHLHLEILRGAKKQTLSLTADKACDYDFILSITDEHQAMAHHRKIIVDAGAVALLKRDDELAFLISHELAHILLGHTLPERESEVDDYSMRNTMEKDADALGIRLMMHAGYDPRAAETALQSIDLIDSGRVTKFFHYHGAYMPADKRIQYLKKVMHQ